MHGRSSLSYTYRTDGGVVYTGTIHAGYTAATTGPDPHSSVTTGDLREEPPQSYTFDADIQGDITPGILTVSDGTHRASGSVPPASEEAVDCGAQ